MVCICGIYLSPRGVCLQVATGADPLHHLVGVAWSGRHIHQFKFQSDGNFTYGPFGRKRILIKPSYSLVKVSLREASPKKEEE